MSEQANGSIATLPHLKVIFDPMTQQVNLEFNPSEFKDWHFVKAMLHAALSKAEELHKFASLQAMQQAAMQQAQAQSMIGKLKMGRG